MTMFEAGATTWLIVLVSAAVIASGPSHLAHMTGSARKIRMYMNHAYLQLNVDGTVSGNHEPTRLTLLRTTSVSMGKVRIQGVNTCMYLCMDEYGIPFSWREFSDECVFNEKIGEDNYNTYTSSKYSNDKRTFYLGMSKTGSPRRILLRSGTPLGGLAVYARVLPLSAMDAAGMEPVDCSVVPRVPSHEGRRRVRPGRRRMKHNRPRRPIKKPKQPRRPHRTKRPHKTPRTRPPHKTPRSTPHRVRHCDEGNERRRFCSEHHSDHQDEEPGRISHTKSEDDDFDPEKKSKEEPEDNEDEQPDEDYDDDRHGTERLSENENIL